MKRVEDAVFALVAYYDLLEYPLTSVELWGLAQALGETVSLGEIIHRADTDGRLANKNGFYVLRGREALVRQRLARYLETELQLRRAWKWLSLVAALPGIKAIFLCNTYGLSNPSSHSDIDLFIVTEPNRIWTARLWSTSLLHLFRKRPRPGAESGAICLSFYITEDHLDIRHLRENDHDICYELWKHFWIPIYDPHWTRTELGAQNRAIERPLIRRRNIRHRLFLKALLSRFPIETIARRVQWRAFPDIIQSKANMNTHVVLTNEILKFHTHDARKSLYDQWRARVAAR